MLKELKNKIIVITGGAGGIGYEIADKYLSKDAKVVIVDINEDKGIESVKILTKKYGPNKAVFIKCDITKDLDTVSREILDKYNYVDVLVNNAGICDMVSPSKTIEVNLTALIKWSMLFREHMRKDKGGNGGTIINLASIYGYRVQPFVPFYHATKFAVIGFTRSLGHVYNFNRTGVRVVAICPGFTESNLAPYPEKWEDEELYADFEVYLKTQVKQKVDAVGRAAVEIFERADSGTGWEIEDNKPIVKVF